MTDPRWQTAREAVDALYVGGVLRSGGSKYHAQALAALNSLEAEMGRKERREGMVTVYDYEMNYVGCMGEEAWAWLLAEGYDSIRERLAEVERLREALRDYAERGVRADLNPTRKIPTPDSFWLSYLERIDRQVRDRARAALGDEE